MRDSGSEHAAQVNKMLERWHKSPFHFVLEAIFRITEDHWKPWQPGTPIPDEPPIGPELWQGNLLKDVAEAVEGGKRKFSIRAGHGVGKSTLEAWLILWFVLFKRPCKVPVTANSQDQLRDVLWAEVAHWHRELPPFLKDLIEINAERVSVRADPTESFAVARTAREEKPEALQGFHSDNLAFFADEASGIGDIIFETVRGALSSRNSWVFMFGNPTRPSGFFYRSHNEVAHLWRTYHVPCWYSSRVPPEYEQEMAEEYGRDSNTFRIRVEGNFPTNEDDAVIPVEWIEAAVNREVQDTDASVVWGLDVARFGDDETALVKRRGNVLIDPGKSWKKLDLMQTVGRIVREYEDTPLHDRPAAINTDVIGLGGGVVDRLRELGLPVRGINVGEAPSTDRARYMRMRDELWFKAREWFQSLGVTIPDNAHKLKSELVQPHYKHESTGKIKVESKDDMKSRGIKSPNLADAFCLTFAGGDHVKLGRRPEQALMYYDPFAQNQSEFAVGARQMVAGTEYEPF